MNVILEQIPEINGFQMTKNGITLKPNWKHTQTQSQMITTGLPLRPLAEFTSRVRNILSTPF